MKDTRIHFQRSPTFPAACGGILVIVLAVSGCGVGSAESYSHGPLSNLEPVKQSPNGLEFTIMSDPENVLTRLKSSLPRTFKVWSYADGFITYPSGETARYGSTVLRGDIWTIEVVDVSGVSGQTQVWVRRNNK